MVSWNAMVAARVHSPIGRRAFPVHSQTSLRSHAAGLSARVRAHARTKGATGAGLHGDVKQASPTLQPGHRRSTGTAGIADISTAHGAFS
jgi:hypothetical protein